MNRNTPAPARRPGRAASKAAPVLAAERIRRTARELFYREGIRAVGVDAIVTRAGVTKPSLYRSFTSKDELAAAYLRDFECEFWARFDAACQAHPGDPRAQVLAYLEGLAERAVQPHYRGCGLTNAAVEYPEPAHPARGVAVRHKEALRGRLRAMCADMGAREPAALADGLLLLIEGAFVSGQIFGGGGPAGQVARAADRLIEAYLRD
ncbi:TetR/AcrR family transcriptional regulator [Achromobacter sp. Marseille-Q4962]|uniref:TetR/AcrR family transcriptional regulator n=1 Tax=Achromobacter sp. Marseille-Q4962 TaxID=2942202 RepID=UPI0020734DE2|nr:TetR/AcrR family transcriptional regulator [Achromobacter sp. Marseille-Q4962]